MVVLGCSCGSKVESNRCCGSPMGFKDTMLSCHACGKSVSVNNCCGKSMKELKM